VLVDASNQCNVLSFQLGVNGNGAAIVTRSWNIKVSFYQTQKLQICGKIVTIDKWKYKITNEYQKSVKVKIHT